MASPGVDQRRLGGVDCRLIAAEVIEAASLLNVLGLGGRGARGETEPAH